VAATGLLAIYTLLAHWGWASPARAVLLAGSICAGWSLARVALVAPLDAGNAWTVVGAMAGGLFFGSVVLIMNLGHWYLVSRSLPFKPFWGAARAVRGARGFRTVYLALSVARIRGPRVAHALRSRRTRSSSSSASCGASSVRSRSRTSSGARPR
jgi:hypothetical protein